MLITMGEMLNEAKKGNYAVPAPNVWNEESTRAAIAAAEECNSPVVLDYGYLPSVYEWMEYTARWCERAKVPISINQDHGADFATAIACIRAGFTSIMVDRSTLAFEENVAQVKELTDIAHSVGVSVEAELGHVGQGVQYDVDRDAALTDVKQAVEYVERTGVDCLAVAIGTAHGPYVGDPYLDFDRLKELKDVLDVPLVLHGGSGTGDDNLAKAAKNGINKVNLYTDLVTAGMEELRKEDTVNKTYHLSEVEVVAYGGYKNKLMHYMKLFDSANKA